MKFYKNKNRSNNQFLIEKSISGLKQNRKKHGKISKSAENANLPRMPSKTQGFLLKPGDS